VKGSEVLLICYRRAAVGASHELLRRRFHAVFIVPMPSVGACGFLAMLLGENARLDCVRHRTLSS
jgi:hypothetical protein